MYRQQRRPFHQKPATFNYIRCGQCTKESDTFIFPNHDAYFEHMKSTGHNTPILVKLPMQMDYSHINRQEQK